MKVNPGKLLLLVRYYRAKEGGVGAERFGHGNKGEAGVEVMRILRV